MTSYQNGVCDTCKLRKVKCDRDDPCGNCVDTNIRCIRTSTVVRQAQSASKRRRATDPKSTKSHKSSRQHALRESLSPSTQSPTVSHSPSILEAHDFICREINSAKNLPANRLAVLNATVSFVHSLSQATKTSSVSNHASIRVADVLDNITYPSIELLYWMLRELKGKKIGPHVLDYFKHVSTKALKHMGLALINRSDSAETLLLYSICVNSAAFKFINTVLSENSLEDVGDGLRTCAANFLCSVKVAMARIYLLSAPSLLFLQSLLCSAFIAQGTGDSMHCWAFITAACKTCEDLCLESQIRNCRSETEEDEEKYYCFVWCHILDKNYSMMLGRSRALLEYDGLDTAFSSPFKKSMSSLLSTYLQLVPIQAIFVSELHPTRVLNNKLLLSRVEFVVQDLLERLETIQAQIDKLHESSDPWDGLHIGSELSTIQFSYHSLRTSVLRSRQICLPAKSYIDDQCLESARMAMATLRAIQEASMTIVDVRSHVAYMHWTVLYHPLTPFFVLYCNVVATSNQQDFCTLQIVTTQLDSLADLSPSIEKLRGLFKSFIELCAGLLEPTRDDSAPSDINDPVHYTEELRKSAPTSQPTMTTREQRSDFVNGVEAITSDASFFYSLDPDNTLSLMAGNVPEPADTDWGLLEIQPTLDWLDADFSFFDRNS